MENNGIINFNDFFKSDDSKKSNFNKEDFNDFFLPEESDSETITESLANEEAMEIENQEEQPAYNPKAEENAEEDKAVFYEEKEEETHIIESNESVDNYYSVYKDKSEDFSCDIQLEGANLNETEARLILESDDWTLMFNGEIDKKGKCTIPIKKLAILNEGTVGKIRLEVIAEGTVFTPWEDDFKVKMSKKVAIKIHESKSNPKKPEPKKTTGVKVNVKR
jgi:hypothetical protein